MPANCSVAVLQYFADTPTRSPTAAKKTRLARRRVRQSASTTAPDPVCGPAPMPPKAPPPGTARMHQCVHSPRHEPSLRHPSTVLANRIRTAVRKVLDVANSLMILVRHQFTHFRNGNRRQTAHKQEQK